MADTADQLDRIESKLDELLQRKRAVKHGQHRARRTLAERAASRVRYLPTELETARAKRALAVR